MVIRRDIIEKLINDRFDGNQAEFARAIKKSSAQVNQWLKGYRNIGDGVARHIELRLKLGEGYMDGKTTPNKVNQAMVIVQQAMKDLPTQDLQTLHEMIGREIFERLNGR